MMLNVRGNGVFWGDPFDSFANNLFRTTGYVNPEPGLLAGVNPARHANTSFQRSGGSMLAMMKHTLSQVKSAESGMSWGALGNGMLQAAAHIAPMLLASEP